MLIRTLLDSDEKINPMKHIACLAKLRRNHDTDTFLKMVAELKTAKRQLARFARIYSAAANPVVVVDDSDDDDDVTSSSSDVAAEKTKQKKIKTLRC